jgi:outer membrane protein OmpA-like peptidoglycan-associated protein
MTFDEQLAAAMVAKLAGSTLQEVDQYTVQQASSGPATRINPASFLTSIKQHQDNKQQQLIQQANRAAEMAFPLPPSPQAQVAPQAVSQPQLQTFTGEDPNHDPNQLTFDFVDEVIQKKTLKQLDLIVDYLYSINNKLETILSRDKIKHTNDK